MATITATVGGAASNSFVTLAEAIEYFSTRLHSGVWAEASGSDRISALLWACRVLESKVRWKGSRVDGVQKLSWPRAYVENPDFGVPPAGGAYPDPFSKIVYLPADTIPDFVKWCQFELALALLSGDTTQDPDMTGLQAISVGPIHITASQGTTPKTLSKIVRDMIQPYGSIIGESGTVKLVRT